jgi:methylenetetrahydrofolate reductase (NADPH)
MTSNRPAGRRPSRISFEFFPPRSPQSSKALWESVQRLAPLGPDFVSVTYGAGGTTRERTMAALLAIVDQTRLSVAGHLTCVGATRAEVLHVARSYARLGCRRIVALRGDPPGGASKFTPHPEGFSGSVELISALAELETFEVWVAAYPEAHPEAVSPEADIEHLKRKLDAGAVGAITQFFYDNAHFYRFRDACAAAGITAPIVPGILPVEDFDRTIRFAENCGATIPDWMYDAFDKAEDDGAHDLLAKALATEQCDDLVAHGVEQLHFYTLNHSEPVYQVCRALGIEPEPFTIAAGSG